MRFILALFLCHGSLLLGESLSMSLAVGENRVLPFPQIIRAAVGDSRILKVKALSSKQLLITGIRPGKTSLKVWTTATAYEDYLFEVLSGARITASGPSVVRVALEFLEVDSTHGRRLGIEWPEGFQFHASGGWQFGPTVSGLNLAVPFDSPRGLVQAMVKEGWGKILAKPELYVRLGEEALFHSGGELPVSTSTENYGRYHRHVEWKPYGITVKVRPQSQDHFHIPADVYVEISETTEVATAENLPSLTTRRLNTKMDFEDRQTMILSGLTRRVKGENLRSVPFLSAVPILGPLLFRSEKSEENESELLMSMTLSFEGTAPQSQRRQALERKWNED